MPGGLLVQLRLLLERLAGENLRFLFLSELEPYLPSGTVLGVPTAVDDVRLAGGKAGLVRCEIHRQRGNLFRAA
jgi:hypothetical protein